MKKVNLLLGVFSAFWLITANSSAQFLSVPLYYGTTNSIVDERGYLLEGTAYSPGALVQLMRADFGIYPPATDGSPHPLNPVMAEVRIGMGTDPMAGPIGKFASSININRYVVNPMFVRVFNRKTREESYFYGDSQIFSNSVTTYSVFIARVQSTCTPLDPDDHDRDNLANAMEMLAGTDPLMPDSDGDGYKDGEEMLAGTDPLDDTDYLQMAEVGIDAEGAIILSWKSAADRWYQIEYSTDMMSGPESFVALGELHQAKGSESVFVIPTGSEPPNAGYRVRLVVP